MALKKTLTIGSLFAIFASGGFAGTADAQQSRLSTPSATFEHREIESPGETGPLATPGVFHYDAQAFAPFEFTNDDQKDPNNGFFFTIDKTYTHVPRSDRNGTSRTEVPVGGDWNWGERYQLGFMTREDKGWQASYQSSEGTYYSQAAEDEAFRRLVALPDGTSDAGEEDFLNGFGLRLLTSGSATVDGSAITTTVPFNQADSFTNEFHVGEVNRVFRQSLKNGGIFEPYMGARYTNVNDDSRQDNVYYYVANDADDPDTHDIVFHRFRQGVTNNAFGFQLGGRYQRNRGRWTYSADSSLSASYNQQRYATSDVVFNDRERATVRESYVKDNSFVPTLDLDVGVSFNITRDITIRGGTQLLYLWNGIARVNTLPTELNPNSFGSTEDFLNDQFVFYPSIGFNGLNAPSDIGDSGLFDDSYIAAGFTFGVEWKR